MLVLTVMGLGAALAPALGSAAEDETPRAVSIGVGASSSLNFGVTPTRLPPDLSTPVTLRLGMEVVPGEPGIPPGLSTLDIGLDRSIEFEPGDLPVCRWPGVQIDALRTECPRAVVGRGQAQILVAFPENTPIRILSKVTVYNGGIVHGAVQLLIEMAIGTPVSGAVRVTVPIRRMSGGRIGSEATIQMPTIASGNGMVTELQLEIGRTFKQEGKRTGFVTAKCRDGKLVTAMTATLTDETKTEEKSVRACTP
jgi:hypothetical protein